MLSQPAAPNSDDDQPIGPMRTKRSGQKDVSSSSDRSFEIENEAIPHLPVVRTNALPDPVIKWPWSRPHRSTSAPPAGPGKQCQPSTYDVWQAASLLIGLYGTEAVDYAAQRRKDLDDRGDRTGATTWGLILSQIERVLRAAPLTQMS